MKKLIYFYFICSFWVLRASAQTPSSPHNFVMETSPRQPYKTIEELKNKSVLHANRTIRYMDRLGRPMQTVEWRISRNEKDYVTHYRNYNTGRQSTDYLPYASSASDGAYRQNAESEQSSFFSSSSWTTNRIAKNTAPYAVSKLREAAGSFVFEGGFPGPNWQPASNDYSNNNTVTTQRFLNDDQIPDPETFSIENSVLRYKVYKFPLGNGLDQAGYYPSNTLIRDVIYTENMKGSVQNGRQEVFKNKDGKTLVKRTITEINGTPRMLSTYYVYDDDGNLAYILPPEVNPDYVVPESDTLNKWCYQYLYNDRGLLVEERLPGLEPTYYVYNYNDQLVARQDANQRLHHRWSIIKYDGLGRSVIAGVWDNSNSAITRSDLQTLISAQTVLFESRHSSAANHGYTDNAWPLSATINYSLVQYYDNYAIAGLPSTLQYTPIAARVRLEYPSRLGTVTKTWTDDAARTVLWTVNYYDDFARVMQSKSTNHLGGCDMVNNTYSFVGILSNVERKHYDANNTLQIHIKNFYGYDSADRLTQIQHKINEQGTVVLARYEYNDIDQVTDKKLYRLIGHPSYDYLQSVDYRYNERGWLTSINDPDLQVNSAMNDGDIDSRADLFGMQLLYDTDPLAPQYNGNIAAARWKTSKVPSQSVAPPKMGYQYRYDALNRLTDAIAEQNGIANNAHDERLSYDISGNIRTLQRKAYTGGNVETIDDLVYTYDGYRTQKIDDVSISTKKGLGYNDLVQLPEEHLYDANGNMIEDKNKGIELEYNDRNLVRKITFVSTPGHTLEFLYDFTGKKLRSIYSYPTGSYTIDYLDGIQYQQGQIAFVHTAEGRARKNGNTYTYEYDLTDHQGNVRVTFRPDPNHTTQIVAQVLQQNSYYPYGLPMYGDAANNLNLSFVSGEKSKYLYSGKELYDQGGLNWFDHGSRIYDPAIGRWSVMDPAAQFANPYLAMGNNPVIGVDPNGEFFIPILAGAAVGVLANGISNTVQDQSFFKGWGMAAVMGGIGGYMSVASSMATMTVAQQAMGAGVGVASSYLRVNIPIGKTGFSVGLSPALFMGNGGAGIGYNVGLSYANENFAIGMSYGQTYWNNHVFTGTGFTESRFGYSAAVGSRDFKFGFGESQFRGGGIDQTTSTLNMIGKNWGLTYENDFMFGMGGDGGDRWRTTGLAISAYGVSAKMHFATGNPDALYGGERRPSDEGVHNGKAAYVSRNGSSPDQFRLGSGTVSYRGLFSGWNSESIRHIGQNRVAHDILLRGESKHFIKLPNESHQGFYYGNRLNNYNTTW